jgi:hypothetical protein
MKYLLALALLSGLSYADQEPEQIYLYILMNGERNKIQALRDEHDTLEDCERAIEASKQGGHTRDIMVCGTNLEMDNRGLWSIKRPER